MEEIGAPLPKEAVYPGPVLFLRGTASDYIKNELGARWLQFSDIADILIYKANKNIAKFLLVNLLTAVRGG